MVIQRLEKLDIRDEVDILGSLELGLREDLETNPDQRGQSDLESARSKKLR